MKKLTSLPLLFFFSTVILYGQVGDKFPQISGTSLTDQLVTVPDATKGKYSLIGLAYSKKAEDDLKTWFQPVYERFIMKADPNALIPEMRPEVHVVFVPMFTGLKRGASNSALRKMQEGVDPKLHPHVIVYSGKMGEYEEKLKLEEKDEPYFFVLDKNGKIIYATSGRSSLEKLKEIEKLVSDF